MYRPLSKEDLQNPQKVQAWLEELQQLEEPRRDRHIREKLVGLWEGVRKVFSSAFQGKEEARRQYRDQAQKVLRALQGSLGPEAKQRLASRYATLVVCADTAEVQAWNEYLDRIFQKDPSVPSDQQETASGQVPSFLAKAAFVRWQKIPIPDQTSPTGWIAPEIALIFWNGGGSVHEPFIYYHELAHVVNREQSGQQLSQDPEWINAWQLEKGALQSIFFDDQIRQQIRWADEAFAHALAAAWQNPQNAANRFPEMCRFFTKHQLVSWPPQLSAILRNGEYTPNS